MFVRPVVLEELKNTHRETHPERISCTSINSGMFIHFELLNMNLSCFETVDKKEITWCYVLDFRSFVAKLHLALNLFVDPIVTCSNSQKFTSSYHEQRSNQAKF